MGERVAKPDSRAREFYASTRRGSYGVGNAMTHVPRVQFIFAAAATCQISRDATRCKSSRGVDRVASETPTGNRLGTKQVSRMIPNALKDSRGRLSADKPSDGKPAVRGGDGGVGVATGQKVAVDLPVVPANYVIKRPVERPASARRDFHRGRRPPNCHPTPPPLAAAAPFSADPATSPFVPQSRYIFQPVRSCGAFANPVTDPRRFIPTDNCISVHRLSTRADRGHSCARWIYLQSDGIRYTVYIRGNGAKPWRVMDMGENNEKRVSGLLFLLSRG